MKSFTVSVLFSFAILCMLVLPIKVEGALVGNWKFDETSGTVAHDSSGNGNDGTVNGATWVSGVSGNALSFDGVNDYVQIADDTQLGLTDAFFAKAWVKWVDGGMLNILFKGSGVNGPVNYDFNIQREGKLNFQFFVGGQWNSTDSRTSVGSISADIWHEVGVSYDRQNVRYWIDGVLDSSFVETTAMLTNNGPLYIGFKGSSWPYDYANGVIDNVRLYDVPEPSTIILLGIGFISLLAYGWRRQAR